MDYIRNMQFGGGMVWAIDLDDFNGVCGGRRNPLLHVMKEKLYDYMVTVPDPSKLTTTAKPGQNWMPSPTTTTTTTTKSATTKTTSTTLKPKPSSEAPNESSEEITITTESPETSSMPDMSGNLCSEPKTQFIAHSDCKKYYWCVHGIPYEQICPKDTIWDSKLNRCEWNTDQKTKC